MSQNMNFRAIFEAAMSFSVLELQFDNRSLFLDERRASIFDFKVIRWSSSDVGNEEDENSAYQQSDAGKHEGDLTVTVEQETD